MRSDLFKNDVELGRMHTSAVFLGSPGDEVVKDLIAEHRVALELLRRATRFEIGLWVLEVRLHDTSDESTLWAIMQSDSTSLVMNHDGQMVYEPSPSNRTPEFIASTRWTFDEALARIRPSISEESSLRIALDAKEATRGELHP